MAIEIPATPLEVDVSQSFIGSEENTNAGIKDGSTLPDKNSVKGMIQNSDDGLGPAVFH
jgi:hypothetical protein